jgi:hypothetical protein
MNAATSLAMQEWMAVIDAAIQGVPEQAQKRRETVSKQFRLKQVSSIDQLYILMPCTYARRLRFERANHVSGGIDERHELP